MVCNSFACPTLCRYTSQSLPRHVSILALYGRKRDEHLGGVVGRHDYCAGVGHGEAELVHGNGEIGDHEEHSAQAGRQLGPGPQVVGQLQASDRPPAHEADQGDVDRDQVGERTGEVRVQQAVAQGRYKSDDQTHAHVNRLHPKGGGVEDVGDGKH